MQVEQITISIDMPRTVLSVLRQEAPQFAAEMRIAAAIKWYEMELVSQSKAAEIAGLPRAEFLNALSRFGVSPFQYDADELIAEVAREQ